VCPPQACRKSLAGARRRERSGVPGFTMAAWVASHAPECTELTVEGDRGFESTFLHQRVSCEPELLPLFDADNILAFVAEIRPDRAVSSGGECNTDWRGCHGR